MSVTLRMRRHRAKQQLERDRALAYDDARALALEIARGVPAVVLDVMGAGLVLNPGETAYRELGAWLYVLDGGLWSTPSKVEMIITNQRLVCRIPDGALAGIIWQGLLGLGVDLDREHVILDRGDGSPTAFAGTAIPIVAVAAVAFVYGAESLLTHRGLGPLRC